MYGKDNDMVGSAEAAEILGISPITLRRHTRTGKIPAVKVREYTWRYNYRVLKEMATGMDSDEAWKLFETLNEKYTR